jgi:CheY-like chemotaxis protein
LGWIRAFMIHVKSIAAGIARRGVCSRGYGDRSLARHANERKLACDVKPEEADSSGDVPILREGTRILLVGRLLGRNCDVQTAADGEEALKAIRAKCSDLILTDVMMPNLDGFGLLRAIRSDPVWHEFPGIMLFARAGEERRVEGLGGGSRLVLFPAIPTA